MIPRLVVLGGLSMRIELALPRWPEPRARVEIDQYRSRPAGRAFTHASAGAALGARVCLIGCVGQDALGSALLGAIRVAGVATDGVRRASMPTGLQIGGTLESGLALLVSAGANRVVSEGHIENERGAIGQAGALVVDDEIPREARLAATRIAAEEHTPLIYVPEREEDQEAIAPVARLILPPDETSARRWRDAGAAQVLVIGDSGSATLLSEGPKTRLEGPNVDPDRSLVAGALAAALLERGSLDRALPVALAFSSLVRRGHSGRTQLPRREEVEGMVSDREGRPPRDWPQRFVSTFNSGSGEEFHVRPILPEDAPRLIALYHALSAETIYRRFFVHRREPTAEEAARLSHVDYQDDLALVVTSLDDPDRLVAVARFAPVEERARAVEMAIVVADAFHGRGIGSELFTQIAEAARLLGHRWMLVETHFDNHAMNELVLHAGYPHQLTRDGTLARYWLDLSGREGPERES